MNRSTWLLIEPTFIGHHYTYLENIIEQANNYNIEIIVATQNSDNGKKILDNIKKKFSSPPQVFLIGKMHESTYSNNFFSLLAHEIKVWNYYKNIYKHVSSIYGINHVFIPYIDDFTYSLSLFGSPFGKSSFSGISMRQQFHLISNKKFIKLFLLLIKKMLFFNLLKSKRLNYIYVIDPKLKEYLDKYYTSFSNKVKYFADPVKKINLINKTTARHILSIPDDNVVILLFGYIDERKGVDKLIDWAVRNNNKTPLTIIIAGIQSEQIKNFFKLNKLTDHLHIIQKDEFISEFDEGLCFSATDLVWVAYTDFYLMSSVLVKSAQAELTIIYYDIGLISYFAKKYGSNPSSDLNFIKKSLSFDNNLCLSSFTNSNNQFVLEHTWDVAGNVFFNFK